VAFCSQVRGERCANNFAEKREWVECFSERDLKLKHLNLNIKMIFDEIIII